VPPQAWIDEANKKEDLDIVLIEHLICELNDNMYKHNF
jgi:tRNA isopentenyl-2-thiomethyl-A-37 hydroxylase MiaE